MTVRKEKTSDRSLRTLVHTLAGRLLPMSSRNLSRRALRRYKAGQLRTAISLWTRAANRGDAEAQHHLGSLYERGEGTIASMIDALHWYRLAAGQGYALSQERLALLLANGCVQPPGMRDNDPIIHALFPGGLKVDPAPEESLRWALAAAEQGLPMACVLVGNHYAFGSTDPDYQEAERWYRKAAKLGNAQAQLGLGTLLAGEYLGTPDYVGASRWFLKAAEQGLGTAWFYLGEMHRHGLGCEPSDLAAACYAQGATLGSAPAQRQLGLCHLHGQGVKQHVGRAETWLRKAALQGDPQSMVLLGNLHGSGTSDLPPSHYEASHWYRSAADLGHREAQYALGRLYLAGVGVPADPVQGFRWFERAATQGHLDAQMQVGCQLVEGIGVEPSPARALEWFRAAAAQGNANALHNIGQLFARGIDGPADWASAVEHYRQAAEAGSAASQLQLSGLYGTGEGGLDQDYAEAARWARLAAGQGVAGAMINLGRFHMQGLGVPQDDTEAERWLSIAAEAGEPQALTALGELYGVYGQDRNPEKARSYLVRAADLGDARAVLLLDELGLAGHESEAENEILTLDGAKPVQGV